MKLNSSKNIKQQNHNHIIDVFNEYFNEYYLANAEVKNVSFGEMKDNTGYYALLEYKNFSQYINVHWDLGLGDCISSCFKFRSDLSDYICYISQVLDYYDSDDIDCYCYNECYTDNAIRFAFENIMSFSKKYWTKLNDIALSYDIQNKIFEQIFADDLAELDLSDYDFSSVENIYDWNYVLGSMAHEPKAYRKSILHKGKRKKLNTVYEQRAYRVFLNDKLKEYAISYQPSKQAKKDETIIAFVCVVISILFGVLCVFIGTKIDAYVLSDWVGRNRIEGSLGFFLVGFFVGLVFFAILPDTIVKPFLPKSRYEEYLALAKSEDVSFLTKAIIIAVVIVLCCGVLFFFTFNGVGMNKDGDILYKKFALSETKVYSLEDTEIAIILGDGDGEYVDTAYAFCLDGEWIDFGVADEQNKQKIEESIAKYNKDVKTYNSVGDIK